jgi:hypothetical protein
MHYRNGFEIRKELLSAVEELATGQNTRKWVLMRDTEDGGLRVCTAHIALGHFCVKVLLGQISHL